jgi:hypothetical protein
MNQDRGNQSCYNSNYIDTLITCSNLTVLQRDAQHSKLSSVDKSQVNHAESLLCSTTQIFLNIPHFWGMVTPKPNIMWLCCRKGTYTVEPSMVGIYERDYTQKRLEEKLQKWKVTMSPRGAPPVTWYNPNLARALILVTGAKFGVHRFCRRSKFDVSHGKTVRSLQHVALHYHVCMWLVLVRLEEIRLTLPMTCSYHELRFHN